MNTKPTSFFSMLVLDKK